MRAYRWSLDLQLFSQEKTEKATPKKKQESRQKGQVAKSMDVPAAFILLFSFLSLLMMGDYYKERLLGMFGNMFEDMLTMELTTGNVVDLFADLIVQGLILLAPIFIIVFVIALIGNYIQVGFLLTGDPLMMKFSKINPIQGFKNIFSMRSVVEFFKSILKLTIIGIVVAMTLWNEREHIMALSHVPIESIFSFTASITLTLGLQIGALLIVLAIFDYLFQRYDYEKSLRMSKQDVKDEYKKTEGNPLIKGRIRERQRRMAMQRMMQEVPKADVIITNPTHFAIALQYDSAKMEAPVIIAKGMDYVALRIKEIAKENGVITMENKPLARALYERTEIGDAVPADLFQAVAEVLAYVYKMKRRVN
ncbi:flagellar biosynthesis protein FlhB [Paenibacillus abyssi]|uniref:Flagellar biosynthetic protein FlhB n=1 Tax=Paenibacillus abyssi TaxID=1340531 RepID=A0A917D649_9BACL|nr:flagellar biosynthesis protein FlhB [Paenibacillus abyssi]GGG12286.1 flagellar biosynthetic protein FlhB [Paenibacillus abyssi]